MRSTRRSALALALYALPFGAWAMQGVGDLDVTIRVIDRQASTEAFANRISLPRDLPATGREHVAERSGRDREASATTGSGEGRREDLRERSRETGGQADMGRRETGGQADMGRRQAAEIREVAQETRSDTRDRGRQMRESAEARRDEGRRGPP